VSERPALVWKIPRRWDRPGLCSLATLYPALYLRWKGHRVPISRDPAPGVWYGAERRVLVCDGPLSDDERELMTLTAARGLEMILAPQAGLLEQDRAFAAELGFARLAWSDEGPLATAPPGRAGERLLVVPGMAARRAEDILLRRELGLPEATAADWTSSAGRLVIVTDGVSAFEEIWPAVRHESLSRGVELVVTGEDEAVLTELAAAMGLRTIGAAEPGLLPVIAGAQTVLCAFGRAPADSPGPGQWVRSALFQGTPVVAASHPSIDGLAHLCVMDDWERGLRLYGRLRVERLKAGAAAQRALSERLDPERITQIWSALDPGRGAPRSHVPRTPLLLVLIDIHQDLDVLLPVLLALRERGEARLRLVLTDWLVSDSPRVLNVLTDHGFSFDIYPREQVRAGDGPPLTGVDGVLSGADANVRAHKSGHVLVNRANERGLPTFTIQHGLENIGLTYKDHLHDEGVRFASSTIFIWGSPEGLAPWAAGETRSAVQPVGNPKATPPPAMRLDLNQGFWRRAIGVFENLHWHRFSDHYRERFIADLEAAAEAEPDDLFIIKPHHAGRWLSRNRELIRERPNLIVIDPTDSAWEPHTAPALIASVDLVLTTPSTVALDAAHGGRPTAVFGYDLELPLYEPLPIIRSLEDLSSFLAGAGDESLRLGEAFLARAQLPGRADHRIAARIAEALRRGPQTSSTSRKARQTMSTLSSVML
jgi:hypothetical protein